MTTDDLVQRLQAFEGSDDLGAGDFSVCLSAADRLAAQEEEIARLTTDRDNWQALADNRGNELRGRIAACVADKDAAIRWLLTAAETVLAGLDARIEAAPANAVPVFDGIAALSDAVQAARAALSGKEPPR